MQFSGYECERAQPDCQRSRTSLTGFFILAIWLQAGEGFSPFVAGLTAVAFSVGMIVFAAMSVNLALRLGRTILVVGGLLMAAGMIAVDAAAHLGGSPIELWFIVPGLFIAGAGLALLIIPLTNVVMSVIPLESAGGASGVFATAQQLGGAVGVAIIGEIFFGALPSGGFRSAFEAGAPIVAAGFFACAVLSLALPKTAIEETYADADGLGAAGPGTEDAGREGREGREGRMIKIALSSVFVDDQDAALSFYTEVLGFVARQDIPVGEARWLTVASPAGPDGIELLLEPNSNPIAKAYQQGAFAAGIPATSFAVDDMQAEYERLRGLGVVFMIEPTEAPGAIVAVFDDTCGNLIQLHQVLRG